MEMSSLPTVVECGKCKVLVVFEKTNPLNQIYHDIRTPHLDQKTTPIYLCDSCYEKVEGLGEANRH
jgi:hypothetical protein